MLYFACLFFACLFVSIRVYLFRHSISVAERTTNACLYVSIARVSIFAYRVYFVVSIRVYFWGFRVYPCLSVSICLTSVSIRVY